MVYVGWVTTQYHIHSATEFTQDLVRTVVVQQIDENNKVMQSVNRQSSYMVSFKN